MSRNHLMPPLLAACLALSCGGSVTAPPDAGDAGMARDATLEAEAASLVDGATADGSPIDSSNSFTHDHEHDDCAGRLSSRRDLCAQQLPDRLLQRGRLLCRSTHERVLRKPRRGVLLVWRRPVRGRGRRCELHHHDAELRASLVQVVARDRPRPPGASAARTINVRRGGNGLYGMCSRGAMPSCWLRCGRLLPGQQHRMRP